MDFPSFSVTMKNHNMMKHFILTVISLCLAAGSSLAAPDQIQENPYRALLAEKGVRKSKVPASGSPAFEVPAEACKVIPSLQNRSSESRIWKPGYAIRTNWDGMQWKDYARYTFTYDSEGRTLSESAENLDKTQTQYYTFSRIDYTYDALGRICKSEVYAGFDLSDMTLVTETETFYDPVREDVVSEQNSYDVAAAGSRSLNEDSFKQLITRDDNGNITAMNAFTWYDGDFMEVQSLEVEYGQNNLPATIIQSVLTQQTENGPLEVLPAEIYSNCLWYECNGQIITTDDLTAPGCHIKSASLWTSDQADISFSADFSGDNYDYSVSYEYMYVTLIPTKSVSYFKELDNGGYYLRTVMDQDLTSVGAYPVQSIQQVLVQYDQFGNPLESQDQTFYGHTIYNSWTKGTVETDASGLPSLYTCQNYILNEGDDFYGTWEDDYKVQYGDWVDAVGIEAVEADNCDAPAEYFDLTGRRIFGAPQGVVIVRRGNRTYKQLIR